MILRKICTISVGVKRTHSQFFQNYEVIEWEKVERYIYVYMSDNLTILLCSPCDISYNFPFSTENYNSEHKRLQRMKVYSATHKLYGANAHCAAIAFGPHTIFR